MPSTRMQIIAEQIRLIEAENGYLMPEHVVEAARPRGHPLHPEFTWDNRKAGEAYRLQQARDLIRSVKVEFVTADEHLKVRQWHAARRAGAETAPEGYVTNEAVVENPEWRAALERQMQRDLISLKRRYGALSRFWDLLAEMVDDHNGNAA